MATLSHLRFVFLACAVLVVAACGGDDVDENDGSSTSAPTTSGTSAGSSPDAALSNDAEPTLRFDVGLIVDVEETDDGTWILFDRFQFYGTGLSGPDLESEPRYEASSDVGFANENPRLRSYPVSADVQVLLIDPVLLEQACAGEDLGDDLFVVSSLDDFIASGGGLASLTFDDATEVVRIRDQGGC